MKVQWIHVKNNGRHKYKKKSSTPVLLSVYIIYVTATAFMCFANKHIIIIIIISPL